MTGGVNPSLPSVSRGKVDSPRSRGIKQGLFIFLLTFLIVPIIAIITVAMMAEPYMVVISAILLSVGGLLRMAYAWMFESAAADLPDTGFRSGEDLFFEERTFSGLPPGIDMPAGSYFTPPSSTRNTTNELQPGSVTESTTRLLENDPFDQ
jgi:hypothetical protein